METNITSENFKVSVKGNQIVIDANTGLQKEDLMKIISEYQTEMRIELKKIDAIEDRLMGNLIKGHIAASRNIMNLISKL